jgi:ATP phosphoribosyltransferase regulatory subunit HisZ
MLEFVFSRGAERNAVSASPVHSISADTGHIFPVSPEAPINTDIEAVGRYAFLNSKPA